MRLGGSPSRGERRKVSTVRWSPPKVGRTPILVIDGHLRPLSRSHVRVTYTPCAGSTSLRGARFRVGTVCFDPMPSPFTTWPSSANGPPSFLHALDTLP